MMRIEVNCLTGEVKDIPLTDEEIAAAQKAKQEEDLKNAAIEAEEQIQQMRSAAIDALLLSFSKDPSAPNEVKSYVSRL